MKINRVSFACGIIQFMLFELNLRTAPVVNGQACVTPFIWFYIFACAWCFGFAFYNEEKK